MTIDKAISILEKYSRDYLTRLEPGFDEAVRLGGEALKFKQEWGKGRFFTASYLLSGETKGE